MKLLRIVKYRHWRNVQRSLIITEKRASCILVITLESQCHNIVMTGLSTVNQIIIQK